MTEFKLKVLSIVVILALCIYAQYYNVSHAFNVAAKVEHSVKVDGINVETGQPTTIKCNQNGSEC